MLASFAAWIGARRVAAVSAQYSSVPFLLIIAHGFTEVLHLEGFPAELTGRSALLATPGV